MSYKFIKNGKKDGEKIMISFIEGKLVEKETDNVVLKVNSLGLNIAVSTSSVQKLPPVGNDVFLYTYLNVKEDALELYGFFDKEEKEVFIKLISVSGIGPKGALAVLSKLAARQVVNAIICKDVKTLCMAQGIGKKTAERLCLELKDKFDEAVFSVTESNKEDLHTDNEEVIMALKALGYTEKEAVDAMKDVSVEGYSTSQLIKMCLIKIDSNRGR